jgi:hypothetical protein
MTCLQKLTNRSVVARQARHQQILKVALATTVWKFRGKLSNYKSIVSDQLEPDFMINKVFQITACQAQQWFKMRSRASRTTSLEQDYQFAVFSS